MSYSCRAEATHPTETSMATPKKPEGPLVQIVNALRELVTEPMTDQSSQPPTPADVKRVKTEMRSPKPRKKKAVKKKATKAKAKARQASKKKRVTTRKKTTKRRTKKSKKS